MAKQRNGPVLAFRVSVQAAAYASQSSQATVTGTGSIAPSGAVAMQYCVKYCKCHSKPLGNATQVKQGNPFKGPVVPLRIGVTHRWCLSCSNWVLLHGYYHIMPPQTTLPPGVQPYNGTFINGNAATSNVTSVPGYKRTT